MFGYLDWFFIQFLLWSQLLLLILESTLGWNKVRLASITVSYSQSILLWSQHWIATKSSLKHSTSFLLAVDIWVVGIIKVFISGVQSLLWILFIDLHDMLLFLLLKYSSNVPKISHFRSLLDFVCNLRIFGEYFFLKELLGKRVGTDSIDCHVDEFWFFVETNVVVTNEGMLLKFDSKMIQVIILSKTLTRHQLITNTNLTFQQEIHIGHFITFFKDVFVFLWIVEFWWLQTKADFEQEVLIFYLCLLVSWYKECPESENDIIKQIMQQNVILYLFWTLAQIFVVNFHWVQSILIPEKWKVTINLIDKSWWKWLCCESCKKKSPVVKVRSITFIAHSLIIVLDNLDERTHDLWEANNTNKHVCNSDKDFIYGNWEIVTIANSWECCQCKITYNDN